MTEEEEEENGREGGQDETVRGGQVEVSEEKEFLLDMFSLSPGNAALAAGGLMMGGGAGGGVVGRG